MLHCTPVRAGRRSMVVGGTWYRKHSAECLPEYLQESSKDLSRPCFLSSNKRENKYQPSSFIDIHITLYCITSYLS